MGLRPGGGTKISHAVWCSQKIKHLKKKKNLSSSFSHLPTKHNKPNHTLFCPPYRVRAWERGLSSLFPLASCSLIHQTACSWSRVTSPEHETEVWIFVMINRDATYQHPYQGGVRGEGRTELHSSDFQTAAGHRTFAHYRQLDVLKETNKSCTNHVTW